MSTHYLWLVAVGLLLSVVLAKALRPSLASRVDRALAPGGMEELLAHLRQIKPTQQPTAYHTAIRSLWERYERGAATALIIDFVSHHAQIKIAQYWLDQLQRVEPELAAKHLDPSFLEKHRRDDLIASCGKAGCSGGSCA
jgi:hypothetical protein